MKRKWAHLALLLALSSLATLGFTAADHGSRGPVVLADDVTCDLEALPYASDIGLEFLEGDCLALATERVERDLDAGFFSPAAFSEFGLAGFEGAFDYGNVPENEIDAGFVAPELGFFARYPAWVGWYVDDNPTERELDAGLFGSVVWLAPAFSAEAVDASALTESELDAGFVAPELDFFARYPVWVGWYVDDNPSERELDAGFSGPALWLKPALASDAVDLSVVSESEIDTGVLGPALTDKGSDHSGLADCGIDACCSG